MTVSIVLAGRNNVHSWWLGVVGCSMFAALFYSVNLYADVALQLLADVGELPAVVAEELFEADTDLAEIPVIMLTLVDDRNLGYTLGATEYLTKPLDRERLLAALRKHR